MESIVVFGAGRHAKVVADVLACQGNGRVVGFLDDERSLHGKAKWGLPVLGGREQFPQLLRDGVARMIVAIGENCLRKAVYADAINAGFELITAVHSSVQLGGGVTIGAGCLLVAGVIVNVDASIDEDVILNTGVTVDHDCRVAAHAHLSPGVHLAGNVSVGELTHIGMGALILPNLTIGRRCVIGAGTVVRESIPDGMVVAGNPAHILRKNEEISNA